MKKKLIGFLTLLTMLICTIAFVACGGTNPSTYKLTFLVEGETPTIVEVKAGEAPNPDDLPDDPDVDELHIFMGWFDASGNEFNKTAPVNADATYKAKIEKNSYTVTFIEDGEEVDSVELARVGAKLTAEHIPEQGEAPADKVKLGWYSEDGVKADVNLSITDNITFYSSFAGAADYGDSIWVAAKAHKVVVFDGDYVTVNGEKLNKNYDSVNGIVSISTGSGLSAETWTIVAIHSGLKVTHSGFDEYDDPYSESFVATKAEDVAYAGTYNKGTTTLTITKGGVLPGFNGKAYARIYEAEGGKYTIEFLDGASDEDVTLIENVTIDGDILIIPGERFSGVYVNCDSFYNCHITGDGTYYLYVLADGSYIYVDTDSNYAVVTITGTIEDGGIVTVTPDGGKAFKIKITDGDKFVFGSAEAGTYTGTAGDLVLDGFGNATLGGSQFTYIYVNGKVIKDDETYSAGYELGDGTYTVLTKDGYEGGYTFLRENDSRQAYRVVLDGFGTFRHTFNGGSLAIGTYSISGTTMTVTNANSFSGSWTIDKGGNVLINATGTSNNGYTYLKDGYTPDPELPEEVDGTWVDASDNEIVISLEDGTITYQSQTVTFTIGADGTSFTFKANDAESQGASNPRDYKAVYSIGSLVITHERVTGFDEDGFAETTTITETYTKKGAEAVPTSVFGTWENGIWKLVIEEANKKITLYKNGEEEDYNSWEDQGNGQYRTEFEYEYTFFKLENGKLTVWGEVSFAGTFTWVPASEQLDALAGTWRFGDWTFEFDGKGKVSVSGNAAVDYEFDGTHLSFNYDWEDWTGTYNPETGTLEISSEYDDSFGTHTVTKQS